MAFAPITRRLCNAAWTFAQDTRGNMTMMFGLAAIPVIAAAGMAIDYARISRVHDEIQLVADGATLAAAGAKNLTGTKDERKVQRVAIATSYLTKGLARVTDAETIGTPEVVATNAKVTISVNASVKGSFINVLDAVKQDSGYSQDGGGGDQDGGKKGRSYGMTISSEATWIAGVNYLCMLVLNNNDAESLHVKGTADINARGCSIWVNSKSNTGLYQNGTASITAEQICVNGNYSGSNYHPVAPRSGDKDCPQLPDPLATQFLTDYEATWDSENIENIKYDGYNKTNKKYAQMIFDASGDHTIYPGRYRGGIKVQNNRTINMEPGVYFIENGNFTIQSGGIVNATGGVTIVLTDLAAKTTKNNSSSARIDVQAGGSLNIKAPAEGPFAGLAIAQHPNSVPNADSKATANSIIGGGTVEMEGLVYYPAQILYITGNGWISQNDDLFAIVADKVYVEGNGQLNIGQAADFDSAGLPALPSTGEGEAKISLR